MHITDIFTRILFLLSFSPQSLEWKYCCPDLVDRQFSKTK